jgi:hypothetical protein
LENRLLDRRSFLAAAAALGGTVLLPQVARANDRSLFQDRIEAAGRRLTLQGTGLFYYRLIIKVAAAGLYLDERTPAKDVLADVPKRLEMQYYWSVKGSDLARGGAALLARNLPPATLAALQPQLDAMSALYRDVRAGDRVALTYVPGEGTSLALNGQTLGTIPGASFAAAYFSIWFGDKPLDAGLKKKLLGL